MSRSLAWSALGVLLTTRLLSVLTRRTTTPPPPPPSAAETQMRPLSPSPERGTCAPLPASAPTLNEPSPDTADRAPSLTLAAYQAGARTTARYPTTGLLGVVYTTLGLAGEAGEIANKLKKVIRDQNGHLTDDCRVALADELGDVLWYVASLAHELGLPLDDIAHRNLAKLTDRHRRGTITGSGDHR